ncbi:DUF2254 domain-containing protein [Arthrobacter sp. ISL-85]|uniref:DUF2254 domain-containing protein n=1 Tax=Arthrobacter sp. ISL-85 TaxID=2819115 RepID=UPI001BE75257|nr:DUF2254 domain-containing protein [Arthrobacter sp. ISL-85]MBT2568824.1 DUF2254 domain-containing protein [Arthrobacter sp. ISL-85]
MICARQVALAEGLSAERAGTAPKLQLLVPQEALFGPDGPDNLAALTLTGERRGLRVSGVRRDAVREYLASALWAMPTCAVVLAIIAGASLSAVQLDAGSPLAILLFQGTSDDARNLLISIASTMVTVIALVLGLTVVALQLASTQFSPRLLRNFLRDIPNQLTLSAFVATFAYSTAGLYTVGIAAGQRTENYPRLAVSGALLLLFVSMVMLVFFVHHLSHSIQVDQVMKNVQSATLRMIERSFVPGDPAIRMPNPPKGAAALPAPRSGYIQAFHVEAFIGALARRDLTARMVPMIGRHVIAGAPLAWVWKGTDDGVGSLAPDASAELRQALAQSVRIGYERTLEQDVAFGIRQLADIASKALSPAINDPYTANQAVDHLGSILAALSLRQHGPRAVTDGQGVVRLHVPARDFAYLVDLALGQVRRYGANEPRVVRALLRVCSDLVWFASAPHRAVVRQYVETLLNDVTRLVPQPADREPLLAEGTRILESFDVPSGTTDAP